MSEMTNNTFLQADANNFRVLSKGNRRRRGVALLVVLFVVMAITVLSLGFLAGSDVELACGQNMTSVTQLSHLAESGLEHARGLVISPHDITSEYWTGATGQQLAAGNEYYDVAVVRDDSDSTDRCNYIIDCNAYRIIGGEQTGLVGVTANLRLDPCIAFWGGGNAVVSQQCVVNGDAYFQGNLVNLGALNGDVFLAGSFLGNTPEGSVTSSVTTAPVGWPDADVPNYYPSYYIGSTSYSADVVSSYNHPSGSFGPSAGNPGGVRYRGSLSLNGGVDIEGTLAVAGDLGISGTGNVVRSLRGFPAIVVGGDVRIYSGSLRVEGLMIVKGRIVMLARDNASLEVIGGLCVADGIREQAGDSSGGFSNATLYNGPIWRTTSGQTGGALEFDGADDYCQTDDSPAKLQLTSDYTLSLWVKPDSVQNNRAGVLAKCDPAGTLNHWALTFDGSSPQRLLVYHPDGYWDTGIRLNQLSGVWRHISVVRNGNQMTSYIDGTQQGSGSWASTPGSGSGHLNIGVDNAASTSRVYGGLLDDVRIYELALDPNDVYPPKDGVAGLIGHWRLDEAGADIDVTAAPCKTAVRVWSAGVVEEQWQQVGGAFYRSVSRR